MDRVTNYGKLFQPSRGTRFVSVGREEPLGRRVILDWIKSTIESIGYPAIAVLMVIENVFPPIPSEVIMPLAGFMTLQNELSFVGVVIAGTTGSLIGNLALYCVGRKIGGERLKRWAGRHGRWLMLSSADLERAKGWFHRHGAAAVLLCRLVPGVRSLISIPAGIETMNPMLFLLLSACGNGIWAGVLAYLGRTLGKNHGILSTYLGPVSYVVFASLVIWYVVYAVRHSRNHSI